MVSTSSCRVTIGLPVYNGARYLAETLDSWLGQDYADFEMVVSDNASADETPAILADYQKRDSRIRMIRRESKLPQRRTSTGSCTRSADPTLRGRPATTCESLLFCGSSSPSSTNTQTWPWPTPSASS